MDNLPVKQLKKIFRKYGIKFVYFFGSRANGHEIVVASDYDFAVFSGTGTPRSRFAKRLKLLHEVQQLFAPKKVDIIMLDDLHSATIRYEVVTTGQVIFDTYNSERIDFEFRALHEYDDFLPFLKAYNEVYIAHV